VASDAAGARFSFCAPADRLKIGSCVERRCQACGVRRSGFSCRRGSPMKDFWIRHTAFGD